MRVRYTFQHQPRLGDDVIIENAVAVPRVGDAVAIYDKPNLKVDHVRWEVEPGTQNVTIFLGYR